VTGTVRVWLIRTSLPQPAVNQCRELLDASERARAAGLDDPADRLRSFELVADLARTTSPEGQPAQTAT